MTMFLFVWWQMACRPNVVSSQQGLWSVGAVETALLDIPPRNYSSRMCGWEGLTGKSAVAKSWVMSTKGCAQLHKCNPRASNL